MLPLSAESLNAVIAGYFLPFVRIAAMITSAPIFSAMAVPARVRLIFALALTAVIAPTVGPVSGFSPFSLSGVGQILSEMLIGIAMGFLLNLAFAAFTVAGQIIAMQMGLGFSLMIDPSNGAQAPVLSMFYLLLVTLLFFTMDGHHVLILLVHDSFAHLPPGTGLVVADYWRVAAWGAQMFVGAVLVALPAVVALLMVNAALGVMGRAAPQLNIFAVGFILTIVGGFFVMTYTLSSAYWHLRDLLGLAFSAMAGLGAR